jgi:DNA polymerase elongation subunit (family B)
MAEKSASADIKTSVVETEESPFIPGEKVIKAVMAKVPEEEPYYPPEVPEEYLPTYEELPFFKAEPKNNPVVLDIETTGANPWDSRIICISARSIDPAAKIQTFFDLDEKAMVNEFLDWFRTNSFNQIIGYNVSFDHRFIFAKCCKYLIRCGIFADAELYDIMNVMQQVKQAYVYGFNKAGSLNDWAEFLLGAGKKMTIDELFKAWEDKRYEAIINYNRDDVELEYTLWLIINYVSEIIEI